MSNMKVVVGPPHEIQLAFEYDGDFPPFVYADSYEAALVVCQNMTHSDVDTQRELLVQWFINRMGFIRKKMDFITALF